MFKIDYINILSDIFINGWNIFKSNMIFSHAKSELITTQKIYNF
jgi:hypothetical protein